MSDAPYRRSGSRAVSVLRDEVRAFFGADRDATPDRVARDALSVHVVCIGNVCRSPLAEAALRRGLDAAGASVRVTSSGIGAAVGRPADETVRRIAAEHGLALDEHRARLFEPSFARDSDLVLTVTRDLRDRVAGLAPAATRRVFALREFAASSAQLFDTGRRFDDLAALVAEANIARQLRDAPTDDVVDPVGRGDAVHREAADAVLAAVRDIVDTLTAATSRAGA